MQNFRKAIFQEVTHGLFTFSFLSLLAVHELYGPRLVQVQLNLLELNGQVQNVHLWEIRGGTFLYETNDIRAANSIRVLPHSVRLAVHFSYFMQISCFINAVKK